MTRFTSHELQSALQHRTRVPKRLFFFLSSLLVVHHHYVQHLRYLRHLCTKLWGEYTKKTKAEERNERFVSVFLFRDC
uniref:Uncharacterized protein n=1 Tax=Rhizophora mucronata TaxID=61149 RepID=A0A2P2LWK3_RHIMU